MSSDILVFSLPTRDWNVDYAKARALYEKFLAYLRGIETPRRNSQRALHFMFLAYLRGIETADSTATDVAGIVGF